MKSDLGEAANPGLVEVPFKHTYKEVMSSPVVLLLVTIPQSDAPLLALEAHHRILNKPLLGQTMMALSGGVEKQTNHR